LISRPVCSSRSWLAARGVLETAPTTFDDMEARFGGPLLTPRRSGCWRARVRAPIRQPNPACLRAARRRAEEIRPLRPACASASRAGRSRQYRSTVARPPSSKSSSRPRGELPP
jgi:hypothetical protein